MARTPDAGAPHAPVLCDAVAGLAAVRAGDWWVDCGTGFGGHAEALLEDGAVVIGLDLDRDALDFARRRLTRFGDRYHPVHASFRDVAAVVARFGRTQVHGLLADLGVSSAQLDRPERGFSFREAGPVDMRLDAAGDARTAFALIRELSVAELADVLRRYGEEPHAGRVARALKTWAAGEGPHDTVTLARAVVEALPGRARSARTHHPATRTFQALRVAVNDEIGALEALLEAIPDLLLPGGRALIISFHSLEDRPVKHAFAEWCGLRRPPAPRRGLPPPPAPPPTFERLTRKSVTGADDEVARNPRARSARLRAVRKLEAAP